MMEYEERKGKTISRNLRKENGGLEHFRPEIVPRNCGGYM